MEATETSAKQAHSRVQQTTVSIAIKHGRNRMNIGGRAMELEVGVAMDRDLRGEPRRGAQEGSPGREPRAGAWRQRMKAKCCCISRIENKRKVGETKT